MAKRVLDRPKQLVHSSILLTKTAAGAKAQFSLIFSARLKSCPDTNRLSIVSSAVWVLMTRFPDLSRLPRLAVGLAVDDPIYARDKFDLLSELVTFLHEQPCRFPNIYRLPLSF